MATTVRRPRVATPERWQRALERAIAGNVQVRQLSGSGAWVATSASNPHAAYELEITGSVVHACSCLAGLNGDAVCCHKARYYHLIGLLDLDPEPEPPAPALAPCGYCSGRGWETVTGKSGAAYRFACAVCAGTGAEAVADDDEPAPARCGRCQGTGALTMAVVGGCGVYPASTTCRSCNGTGAGAGPVAAAPLDAAARYAS